jgi:hypothetical protein
MGQSPRVRAVVAVRWVGRQILGGIMFLLLVFAVVFGPLAAAFGVAWVGSKTYNYLFPVEHVDLQTQTICWVQEGAGHLEYIRDIRKDMPRPPAAIEVPCS